MGAAISLIQGEADTVAYDVLNRTVDVEGRDLTARLLDARTQETFSNQTASEIAETLAGRHGLTPNVSATSTLAGRYYSTEHDRITLGQFSRATTEWDLLSFLAAREGFDVFVAGQTLTFAPPSSNPATMSLTPDLCISLQLDHSLTAGARHRGDGSILEHATTGSVYTDPRVSSGQAGGSGPVQRIVVVRPNLATLGCDAAGAGVSWPIYRHTSESCMPNSPVSWR